MELVQPWQEPEEADAADAAVVVVVMSGDAADHDLAARKWRILMRVRKLDMILGTALAATQLLDIERQWTGHIATRMEVDDGRA